MTNTNGREPKTGVDAGVIGVGAMGANHARVYSELRDVTLVGVAVNFSSLHPVRRRAVVAYATFGPAVLAVLALAYVNVARGLLTVQVAVGVGLAATATVYVGLGTVEREPAS